MTEMEYTDFLFSSLQDSNAEIKRSHDEIERLTGEVAELRMSKQALERHLKEAEADNLHQRDRRNAARECIKALTRQRDELLKG